MKLFKKALIDFILSYWIPAYNYDYWHFPHYCSAHISQGEYFINYIPKLKYDGPRDAEGIPLLDLGQVPTAKGKEVVTSPVLVSQYALGLFSLYLYEKNQEILRGFIRMANWLVKDAKETERKSEKVAVCYMNFGQGPVLSGMAQGQAISVWCRAYDLTQESIYLEKAIQAFNLLKVPLEDGGVVNSSSGFPILEEWVDEPYHILNGHLFAFAGIYELLQRLPAEMTQKSAEMGKYYELYLVSSLWLMQQVDLGFWTRYSLRPGLIPNIASYFYHHLHVEMMKGLYLLTGLRDFDYYTKRWRSQMRNPFFKIPAMMLKLADKAIKMP